MICSRQSCVELECDVQCLWSRVALPMRASNVIRVVCGMRGIRVMLVARGRTAVPVHVCSGERG